MGVKLSRNVKSLLDPGETFSRVPGGYSEKDIGFQQVPEHDSEDVQVPMHFRK